MALITAVIENSTYIITVKGSLSFEEMLKTASDYYSNSAVQTVIWDMRDAKIVQCIVTLVDLMLEIRKILTKRQTTTVHQVIFVTNDDDDYPMMNVYASMARGKTVGITYTVSRTLP